VQKKIGKGKFILTKS